VVRLEADDEAPATFGAAVAYQGYFRPHFDGHLPFQPNAPQARSYDLIALEKTNPVPVSLRLFASDANKVSYPSVKEILTVVKRPTDGTARIAQAAATACRCGRARSRARSTGSSRCSPVSHRAPERRGSDAGEEPDVKNASRRDKATSRRAVRRRGGCTLDP